jgi:hypothetical protein
MVRPGGSSLYQARAKAWQRMRMGGYAVVCPHVGACVWVGGAMRWCVCMCAVWVGVCACVGVWVGVGGMGGMSGFAAAKRAANRRGAGDGRMSGRCFELKCNKSGVTSRKGL